MKCSTYRLTIASFAIASASVAVLSLAVSTDSWLHTRERLNLPTMSVGEDGTQIQMNDSWVRVWAGMWRLCMEMEDSEYLGLAGSGGVFYPFCYMCERSIGIYKGDTFISSTKKKKLVFRLLFQKLRQYFPCDLLCSS